MKWIRPIISLFSILALIYGWFRGMVDSQIIVPVLVGAVAWWYASREKEKKVLTLEDKQAINAAIEELKARLKSEK